MRPKPANAVAFILLLASFACLIPGLTHPALTLEVENQVRARAGMPLKQSFEAVG